ncbi:MAG: hypothetical protein U1F83_07645 [Verrucomicrobiota bacterium]
MDNSLVRGAMAAVDFRARPVAGIASRVLMSGIARPGQTLELAAVLESVDDEAIGYSGSARVNGVEILSLQHCVGPMMPVEEFDELQLLRARPGLLRDVSDARRVRWSAGNGVEPD